MSQDRAGRKDAAERTDSPPASEDGIFETLQALLARVGLDYRGDFVTVEGLRLHSLDYGPDDAAGRGQPPVILIHGAGPGAGQWFREIAILKASRRVIALDMPLFGLSDGARPDTDAARFGGRFVAGFMDAVGFEQADIAGLSLGGAVALRLALARPERVRRVAIINSAGLGRAIPFAWRLVVAPSIGRLIAKPTRAMRRSMFRRYEVARPTHPDAEAFIDYSLAVRARPGRAEAYNEGARAFIGLLGQRIVFSDDDLSRITAPTLVIWGRRDRVLPVRHGERAARLIPDARLEVIDDAGHIAFWDAPERIADLMQDFFDEGDAVPSPRGRGLA